MLCTVLDLASKIAWRQLQSNIVSRGVILVSDLKRLCLTCILYVISNTCWMLMFLSMKKLVLKIYQFQKYFAVIRLWHEVWIASQKLELKMKSAYPDQTQAVFVCRHFNATERRTWSILQFVWINFLSWNTELTDSWLMWQEAPTDIYYQTRLEKKIRSHDSV